MKTNKYVLPSFYACYLINSDSSGLTDDEIKELDQWIETVNPGYCVDMGEPYFSPYNQLTGYKYGSDVSEFTFIEQ